MRKHTVRCVVENCGKGNTLTGEVNLFWKDMLRERMRELGLTQEEQIRLIDGIIENVKKIRTEQNNKEMSDNTFPC